VLDDTYNANPTSMRAALEALAGVTAVRRIAVLGEMAELEDPVAGHREIAELARALGIELVATSHRALRRRGRRRSARRARAARPGRRGAVQGQPVRGPRP
jgi:UDP-N-acetylmuramyl pentapeptide synthase